jgi:8-oxo-dGTP pyrophosphatase MutT (NUDIX family)
MINKICCLVYSLNNNNELNFLILHRNNWWNGWEFIRGDINNEEDAFKAALRAVNEQTGLNIEKVNPISFNYSYEYLKELNSKKTEVSCFAAKSLDSEVNLSNEHNFYKWVDYETAMKLLDFDEQKKLLEFFKKII